MFDISEEQDKRLKALPMLEYLKYMQEQIKGISHRNKTNSAYSEAMEYVRHIKYRFVSEYKLTWEEFDLKFGHNLKLSADILDLYSNGESDKRKAARIKIGRAHV